MGQDVLIPSMPEKPKSLLPSDDSFQAPVDFGQADTQGEQQRSAQSQPVSQTQPTDQSAAAPLVGSGSQDSGQAKIVIKYPDGREVTMEVVNVDSVVRVAKANKVLRGPKSGLSASFPQTSQPQPQSTSSLPTALAAGRTEADDEEIFPVPDDDEEVEEIFPIPTYAEHYAPKQSQKKPAAKKSSGTTKDSTDDNDNGQRKAKQKKPQQKYQSISAPTVIGRQHVQRKPDTKKMFSTPLMR